MSKLSELETMYNKEIDNKAHCFFDIPTYVKFIQYIRSFCPVDLDVQGFGGSKYNMAFSLNKENKLSDEMIQKFIDKGFKIVSVYFPTWSIHKDMYFKFEGEL